MEISNKTLALFLVGAIVVSLAGTIISLNKLDSVSSTGYVTDTGTANLTVTSAASVRFAIDTVVFGSGSVNTSDGNQKCSLVINATSAISRIGCINFSATNAAGDTFIIENDGNKYLNITVNSTMSADTLVGGTGSLNSLMWTASNNESTSCVGSIGVGAWAEIVQNASTNICTNLSYADSTDSLRLGINVTIPYDSVLGTRNMTIYVVGTEFA